MGGTWFSPSLNNKTSDYQSIQSRGEECTSRVSRRTDNRFIRGVKRGIQQHRITRSLPELKKERMEKRVLGLSDSLRPAGAEMNDCWNPIKSCLLDWDHKLHVRGRAFQVKKLPSMLQRDRASKRTKTLAMLDTVI